MNKDKIVANVYETSDYNKFKKLLGNRDVPEQLIAKIMESIKSVGYVLNPCVINGKNEIIDGQGRIEALKRLGMPVNYVIDMKAGLEQCVHLNINGTPWTTNDYIHSYIQQGNENYKNLSELMELFPDIGVPVIAFAIQDVVYEKKGHGNASLKHRNCIITGDFICSEEQKEVAYEKLVYVSPFVPISKVVRGTNTHFLKAIIFAAFIGGADRERLYKKVFERQQEIVPFTNVKNCLASITKVYNHNNRVGKIDFEHKYVEYCEQKNASYVGRWLKGGVA